MLPSTAPERVSTENCSPIVFRFSDSIGKGRPYLRSTVYEVASENEVNYVDAQVAVDGHAVNLEQIADAPVFRVLVIVDHVAAFLQLPNNVHKVVTSHGNCQVDQIHAKSKDFGIHCD